MTAKRARCGSRRIGLSLSIVGFVMTLSVSAWGRTSALADLQGVWPRAEAIGIPIVGQDATPLPSDKTPITGRDFSAAGHSLAAMGLRDPAVRINTSTASVSPVDNAINSYDAVPLDQDQSVPRHSVDLTWDPSTSKVTRYNIYRGTEPIKESDQPMASTSGTFNKYTDPTVEPGRKYFYAVRAVGEKGDLSNLSNVVQVTVPSP